MGANTSVALYLSIFMVILFVLPLIGDAMRKGKENS
jgi:hypothetical protein